MEIEFDGDATIEFVADLDQANEDPTEVLAEYGFVYAGGVGNEGIYTHQDPENDSRIEVYGSNPRTSLAQGYLDSAKGETTSMGRRDMEDLIRRLGGMPVRDSFNITEPLGENTRETEELPEFLK